ncbi:MAG: tyrosine-type recombinase/integrase [Nitrospiraceae bacterium]|nr:tyrosine-type recombinase/integrase [Nitrospiraceae bacterium]
MAGKIRTREKCSRCKAAYTIIEEQDIVCPKCGTRPKSFYIFIYREQKKYRITRDPDGHVFDSFKRAHRTLEKIRAEIDARTLKIENYFAKEVEEFRGHVLFPRWFDSRKRKRCAKSYLDKINQYINDHFIPQLGDLDMRSIKTHHVDQFQQYLMSSYISPKTGKPLSPKSVKNTLDALKGFCHWLRKLEIIIRLPEFEVVDVPEHIIDVMPLEDRKKALAAVRTDELRAILSFFSFHPIRPSEGAALDGRHFDLVRMKVKIEMALDSDRSLKTRKSKKAYEIPLSVLWDRTSIEKRAANDIAFPNKNGGRYNDHTLNEAWKSACKRAGVKYVSLYPAMRHTTATNYADRGASEEQIEQLLGHSTKGMSRKYVKRSVELVRHIVDDDICEPIVNQKTRGSRYSTN